MGNTCCAGDEIQLKDEIPEDYYKINKKELRIHLKADDSKMRPNNKDEIVDFQKVSSEPPEQQYRQTYISGLEQLNSRTLIPDGDINDSPKSLPQAGPHGGHKKKQKKRHTKKTKHTRATARPLFI